MWAVISRLAAIFTIIMFGVAYFSEWPVREMLFWGVLAICLRMGGTNAGENDETKQ
jgi:hypothetical protein